MNKKYLFIIALVIFAVGLLIFKNGAPKLILMPKSGNQSTGSVPPTVVSPFTDPAYVATATPKIKQIDVEYTDSGFNPAKITIKKGGAVVFYNKSKKVMLLGSKLPPFNQTLTGDVYAYTFSQAGSWDFQNQKYPTDGGTVTVTE